MVPEVDWVKSSVMTEELPAGHVMPGKVLSEWYTGIFSRVVGALDLKEACRLVRVFE